MSNEAGAECWAGIASPLLIPRPDTPKSANEALSQLMPSPSMDAVLLNWLVERWFDSRYVGPTALASAAPSHHPAVLVLEYSGEAENPKSMLGDVSVGPHVFIGRRSDEGGVCKAERFALDTDELKVRPMLSVKGSLLFGLLFEMPMAGEA
jgi:hypothetical protein